MKKKGNVKLKVISALTIVMMLSVIVASSMLTQTFAATSLVIPSDSVIFTDNEKTAELKLSANGQGNNLCVFTKNAEDNFTKIDFKSIGDTDKPTFSVDTSWVYKTQNEYYVAVTDKSEEYINAFDSKTGTVTGNTVTVEADNDTQLELQKIIVVFDQRPWINNVEGQAYNWTKDDVTLTVTAGDSDGTNNMEYSFDDGVNWQSGNSKTFTQNQVVKIKVKDECGRVCEDARTINIDKIDKTAPTVTILDKQEHKGFWWFPNNAIIKIKAEDGESGIDENSFNVNPSSVNPHISNLGNGEYKVEFEYHGSINNININLSIKDKAGNVGTKTNLIMDNASPTASIDNSTVDETWKKGSSSFEFTAKDNENEIDINRCLSDIPSDKGTVEFALKDGTTDTYAATVTAKPGQTIDQKVKLTIKDPAGNFVEVTTEKNIRIDNEKPGIKDIKVEDKNDLTKTALKAGDTATVSFNLDDHNGAGYDNDQTVKFGINGSALKTATFIDGKFTADFVIGTDVILTENEEIIITNLICEDKVGNKLTVDETVSFGTGCYFLGDIEISAVKFTSNNPNNYLAKNGDKVCVEFTVSHGISILGNITQGTNHDTVKSDSPYYDVVTDLYTYKVYLTATDIPSYDNKAFKFDLSITDGAKNTPIRITDEDTGLTPVIYYAPIDSTIESIALASDGANAGFAKKNDNVKLNIKTKHPVNVFDTNIAGENVTLTTEDNISWSGSKEITGDDLSDNSDIPFLFKLSDAAGNEVITKTQSDVAKVKFYDKISLSDIHMTSDNNNYNIARNGNKIQTSFRTSHPVILTSSKIAGKNITFHSDDNMNWTAEYTVVQGDITDNSFVPLFLAIDDIAGNEQLTADQNSYGIQKIKYFAPIKITDVVITTNNSKNGNKYAKNGDQVKVTFKSNHDVTISDSDILGKNTSLSKHDLSGPAKQFIMTYTINNGDIADLSTVKFAFKADDIAGNPQIVKKSTDSDVRNSIQYYSPITAQTSISSSYKKTDYAKNGDTITVSSRSNHDVSIVNSKVFSRDTVNTIENGKSLKMSYRIPLNENTIAQGNTSFAYTLTDDAGNILSINQPSVATNKVTYDRIHPTVSMTPQLNGFTNKNISYTFSFADENLSASDISVSLNGVEQLTQGDKASTGKTFRKTISLSAEKEYEIIATLLDSAGNKCQQDKIVKITVDKTLPKVTSSKVDLTKSTSFKSGMKLSEILDIQEKYIKEVICSITDSDGTRDIDINDAITGDGKKTVNIIVKDMAGNISQAMTYDFYIDGTPPKFEIKDTDKKALSLDKTVTFKDKLNLKIGLDSFGSDKENKLEKFTTLKLLNSNGNLVVDLLEEETPLANGGYEIKVDKFGKYTLEVQAVDSAGNDTGLLKYNFVVKDKTVVEKYVSNKPLMIASIAGVIAIVGVVVLIIIKRKNRYYL